jgi:hypothetical protein
MSREGNRARVFDATVRTVAVAVVADALLESTDQAPQAPPTWAMESGPSQMRV